MDKILIFIKKYTSLMIPVGIVLIALVFIVLTLLFGGPIKEKMSKSAKQGQAVDRAVNSAHSAKDVDDERYYQDQLEVDAKKVEQFAKQTTQRELISYDIFPEPEDSSVQIFSSFGKRYRTEIEDLLKNANARSAPTQIEITSELERRGSSETLATRGRRSARSRAGRGDAFDLTKDAFLKKRAREMSLYATAKIFDWYSFWDDYIFENEETAVEHCWYSQVAFWVYEDVVEAVKAMNSGSTSVFNSDIKRLAGVNFTRNADYLKDTGRRYGGMGGMSGMGGQVAGDSPDYILYVDKPGIFGFDPWTGRICDDDIDVIHFSVAVVIRADAVFPFIKELCSEKKHVFTGYLKKQAPATFKRNQITVLQYWQEPVDVEAVDHERYRYGDNAVVKLGLTCEYIFNRSGYDEIKPTSIIEKIKVEAPVGGMRGMDGMF